MYLIVGLGNPGREYELSRHNVGFIVTDLLVDQWDIKLKAHRRHQARVGKGTIAGQEAVVAQPLTYMNLSGQAVGSLARWYRLPPQQIIVVSDDIDLEVGRIRIRPRGHTGGHHGLDSIVAALGSRDFIRLRIGIGRPQRKEEVADYVLAPFSDQDWELVKAAIHRAVQAIEAILAQGVEKAMNQFNSAGGS